MKLLKKQGMNLCFAVIVAVLAAMPLLLQSGVLTASSTILYLGKCIAFAIVAMGLDLIWGCTGILSLGHGLYFALGSYAMAMYLKVQATGGSITDFMHVGGLTDMPMIWKPFQTLLGAIIMLFVVPTVVSGLIGYFIFKKRGNIFLLFYGALLLMVLTYVLCRFLTTRKFGKLLVAIRDGENRTCFSGYQVSHYKTFAYVLSAIMAAVAGAVFVNFNGSITPSQMTISYSITMVIWVAVGGRGTIIGAFLINLCEYKLSSGGLVNVWQYIIGAVFVLTILFMKGGLVGLFCEQLPALLHKERKPKVDLVQKTQKGA